MTGDNLFTHQLPRAFDECKPYLVAQFPQLAIAKMETAIAKLDEALKTKSGKAKAEKIVANWLTKQVARYGEMFVVRPIPIAAHEVKDPIVEVAEIMGSSEKVIVVRI